MLNIATIQGRLTASPEFKVTSQGTELCTFTIASDRGKDKGADFIPCVAWRQTATFIHSWFGKGDMIIVSGRIQSRSYEDRDGNKRTAYDLNVEKADFCGGKKEDTKSETVTDATDYSLEPSDLPF